MICARTSASPTSMPVFRFRQLGVLLDHLLQHLLWYLHLLEQGVAQVAAVRAR